ncbi:hypothetical protein EV363DRAFT_1175949 [Boletus edulis]|uniref:Uncharacterized protein n=1 Tax=Boletus edulis BED1 TaxID=1328754 RepID=A0AAD4GIF7_BOLED|nr:hypothetical protein EV363DRAFT_1175949 [Boletus edulis]KAF8444138.1 hypothetical protein L210DRAFT_3112150 [Boletus edulis BED1]
MTRIKAVSGALIVGYLQSLCLLTYHAELYTSTRRLSLSRMCRTGGLTRGSWGRRPGHLHKASRLSIFGDFFITRLKCFGRLSDDMF